MPQFVLEIGTEEMPARFLAGLMKELAGLIEKGLTDARIEYSGVRAMATPRRLTAIVAGVPEAQRTEEIEVTGPPAKVAFGADGSLSKAGLGFAKSQGVEPESLFTVNTGKGDYVAARKTVGGGRSLDILSGICADAVKGLTFPKKMRWGSGDFAFGRPVRWFLALLGADVVSFEVGGTVSGRLTWGHRVMGPGPFEVSGADAYLDTVREQCKVVLDPEERAAVVRSGGDELAAAMQGKVVWKDSLMAEVVNLVEHPRPLLASFDPVYLELPREVLLTSMESHQKSFGVEDASGKLLPHFLTVINLVPKDEAVVRKGWERVLKARLEDARFFWKTDLASDFAAWRKKLDAVVFIGPLGSMGAKTVRLERLCSLLAGRTAPELAQECAAAGRIAKCDLVSEMVGEFAELQGVMGGIYARKKGESEATAQAVAEHYLPTGPDSPAPASLTGALLAIADKADTLAGCFGLGMVPTGAADPYALRRQALGICRIVLTHKLRLSLRELLSDAQVGYAEVAWKHPMPETLEKLLDFFAQRLKAQFVAEGFDTLVVEACLGAGFDDVQALSGRINALAEFSREADFGQAVLTFKRAANIIRKQGSEAGVELTGSYLAERLETEQERRLAERLEAVRPRFEELWAAEDYASLLGLLRELRPDVDAFFDNVMVMCDDEALRLNRLNLLHALVSLLGRLADFGALQI